MTQIIGTNRDSKCMYCDAKSYGNGCPYSPHKRHVHGDDPKRCIYCGSASFGIGCPYNPFGRVHIHGVEYNQMMKESAYNSYTVGIFLHRLIQPIKEMEAYKIGLIDDEGKKLRESVNAEDSIALTPLDSLILKVRRLIGEDKLELLNANVLFDLVNKEPSTQKFDTKLYENEVKLKQRINTLVQDYKNIIADGINSGLSSSTIENIVIEGFLNDTTKTE